MVTIGCDKNSAPVWKNGTVKRIEAHAHGDYPFQDYTLVGEEDCRLGIPTIAVLTDACRAYLVDFNTDDFCGHHSWEAIIWVYLSEEEAHPANQKRMEFMVWGYLD